MGLGFKLVASLLLISAAMTSPGHAGSLVINGNFEIVTKGTGQFNNTTTATGWSSTGYNFIFGPGTADTTGSNGQYGNLKLWGPNDGSANGLPTASPSGGNFVGADGAFQVAPIQQTINGLTVGANYDVGFDWAGAQQHGFNGLNTEQWVVGLGSQTHSTAVAANKAHGFTGWMHQIFTFTAQATSSALSFLAVGTPSGVPPFALLDGVTLNAATAVPEPATWTMMMVGIAALGGIARSRRKLANPSANGATA